MLVSCAWKKTKWYLKGFLAQYERNSFSQNFFREREREREELKLEIDFESHTELAFSYIRQS